MTRVLVIEGSGNLWGSERALLDLLREMPASEIAVCCPPDRPLIAELEKLHLRTLPYFVYCLHEKTRWHRLSAAIGVLRACVEFRPDVLYINQGGSYKIALPAAVVLNIPIIAHVRILEDVAYLARQSLRPHLVRGLIAISSAIEEEIHRFRELNAIPLHQIYDSYSYSPELITSSPVVRITNRIACVGRIVPIKGQDVLVRALSLLNNLEGGVECLIAGDGEARYVQELKQLAADGNCTSSIRWLGFVGEIVPLLRTCSVLACPSHYEPLGRVIFEAWDAGVVPIVFAGSGGAAEVVAAAGGGILYGEKEPKSLAEALQRALELDREEAARLIDNGRSWMIRNCNPKSYGSAVYRILSDAHASRSRLRQ